MKAFKFRSEDQFSYALDIIFNEKLRCSDWTELNDPVEGAFVTSREPGGDYSDRVDRIIREKKRLKVCALSKTFDSHLLWAHYASGFSGLAIEVEIPDPSESSPVQEVEYGGVFAHLHIADNIDPMEAAEEVLSRKYKEWEPEQEVRILHDDEWFYLDEPVCRVIAGHRMSSPLFKGLQVICERQDIALCRTGIGDEGIDADPVPQLDGGDEV